MDITRKLRMGMIGGGKGSFMGTVHRIAAGMDNLIELSCGALSADPAKAKSSGKALYLPDDRIYLSYEEMISKESLLPAGKKMDFVSIVTPNFLHFRPAMMAMDHGFHVVVEKPMTVSVEEARQLKKKSEETGMLLCLTHTYSGYPMVKQARYIIANGALGTIRKILVEYPQGWLSRLTDHEGDDKGMWRADPSKSGPAGCMGDIGTHAAHLAEYISGLKITKMCADLHTVVKGRILDDDGNVLLKFDNGANGVLVASQICAGEENNLKIRIYGEKGGLEWAQQEPNTLLVKWLDKPAEILRAGNNYPAVLSKPALDNCRVPGGHPEGYLEAFANIYKNFALTLSARLQNKEPTPEMSDFPGAEEGIRGMAFIENVIASSGSDEKWIDFRV